MGIMHISGLIPTITRIIVSITKIPISPRIHARIIMIRILIPHIDTEDLRCISRPFATKDLLFLE